MGQGARRGCIAVGDYVVPDDDYANIWTPCKVHSLVHGGDLRAVSDDGRVRWFGAAASFRVVRP